MAPGDTNDTTAGIQDLVKQQSLQQLLQPLPFYDGTSLDACRQWLEYLDFVFEFIPGDVSEKTHLIKRAALSRASGDVLQYLYKFLKDDNGETPIEWAKLRDNIQQRFGDPSIMIAAQAELNRPRQQPFETPQSFVDRVRNLAKIAYNSTDYENGQIQANLSKLVIGGLNDPHLAKRIHKKGKNKLNDVFDEIVAYLGEQRVFNLIRDPVLMPFGTDTTVNNNPFLNSTNQNSWPASNSQNSFNILNHGEPMEVSALNKKDTSVHPLTPKLSKILHKNEIETNSKIFEKNEDKSDKMLKNEKFNEIKADLNKINQDLNDGQWREIKNAISEIESSLKNSRQQNNGKNLKNSNFNNKNARNSYDYPKKHFSYKNNNTFNTNRESRPVSRNVTNNRRNYDKPFIKNRDNGNSRTRAIKKVTCFNCGGVNHYSNDCNPGITCFKCQGNNHKAQNCKMNLN